MLALSDLEAEVEVDMSLDTNKVAGTVDFRSNDDRLERLRNSISEEKVKKNNTNSIFLLFPLHSLVSKPHFSYSLHQVLKVYFPFICSNGPGHRGVSTSSVLLQIVAGKLYLFHSLLPSSFDAISLRLMV